MSFARVSPALTLCALASGAQPLSISLVDTAPLPSSAIDQSGAPFAIAEASGVTYLGDSRYAAVLDGGGKVFLFTLTLNPDDTVASISDIQGLSLDRILDFEGIAPGDGGTILLSEENSPGVAEFSMTTGVRTRRFTIPAVFSSKRANRGFESLTRAGASLWTANEEALTVDGPTATPSLATVVRLLELDESTGAALGQFAYTVEPMHGPFIPVGDPGRSGLSDLVALPDGSLLALERSLAFTTPVLLSRIYRIDLSGATDISALPALDGAAYTPATKTLLWSGGVANMEGLTLGQELAGGGRALVGVVDDGDPFSTSQLVLLRLTGLAEPCPADLTGSSDPNDPSYARPDGDTDGDDFFFYLDAFTAADLAVCDFTGSSDPNDPTFANPDNDCDGDDFFYYLDLFSAGCP
ncbi:MAG: esterase-like activity of phytase family protein [Phycisphaerales bacterium JB037]